MEKIKNRSEVAREETWDLTALFSDETAFEQALEEAKAETDRLVERYQGKIQDGKTVNQALEAFGRLEETAGKIAHYAMLDMEVDVSNPEGTARYLKTVNELAGMDAKTAFLKTELADLEQSVLQEAKDLSPDYRRYLDRLIRKKKHMLSAETESVLAAFSPILKSPYQTYSDIKFGDIHFADFEYEGKTREMTYNSFENRLEQETNTGLRREAFDRFHQELDRHKHATASAYNTQLQREKIESGIRGYDSVFDMLLDLQEVPRDLYDRQIDLIMEKLAPAMRRYAKLLGKIHGLDRVTTADLKIEVDPDYSPHVSFEETEAYITEGLSVLGRDYRAIMTEAFANRWIDYAENRGKRTGAFCASPYGSHSYILTSFNAKMDEVMTLAHELGHAGHFELAGRRQNIYNYDCSMYFVEAPSTTNEIIMANYLLKQAGEDKRRRRWILSQMVSKTYYHNFVTHLLEAAYQREVYRLVDRGESVNADILSGIYKEVLEDFWGEEVEVLEGSYLTWMRQPHYYDGLYSYTYSAGLTIGTQMAKRILEEGDQVAEDWIRVLEAGGSKDSVELAAMAGVDITTDGPLLDTIDYISSLIDEIESLTEELAV